MRVEVSTHAVVVVGDAWQIIVFDLCNNTRMNRVTTSETKGVAGLLITFEVSTAAIDVARQLCCKT